MDIRSHLLAGQAIPALPLALDENRDWSQRYQRAVMRYYRDSGVGGIAVGVHSTQFEIREPEHALFEPLLKLASEEMATWSNHQDKIAKIAGLCGTTQQAVAEAKIAQRHGYHAGLLSLAAMKDASLDTIVSHCAAVAEVIPIIGFYLQPAVGGRVLPYTFWRKLADVQNVVAIKMAPFNRYQTFDVVKAVMDAGRDDIALYTGNDDNIVVDLLTPWRVGDKVRFIEGGLLGQFGVWTERAVALYQAIKKDRTQQTVASEWLDRNVAWTDANAAVFDAANAFAGCIPGIHEVLRRQGLLPTNYCLDPALTLSPGQSDELDRVCAAYPWLIDDDFVKANLANWLS